MNSLCRIGIAGLSVTLFCMGTLFGQSSPNTPLPKSPTKDARWFLDFTAPKKPTGETKAAPLAAAAPPRAHPVSMEVSNGDGVRLFKTKLSDGTEETAYVLPPRRVVKRSNDENIRVVGRQEPSRPEYDAPLNVFPGFSWVTPSHYRGEVTLGERLCFKYTRELPPADVKPGAVDDVMTRLQQGGVTEAYVDKVSLLPVAYTDGGTMVTYKFSGLSSPIIVPEDFRQAVRRQAGYRTE